MTQKTTTLIEKIQAFLLTVVAWFERKKIENIAREIGRVDISTLNVEDLPSEPAAPLEDGPEDETDAFTRGMK